MLPRFKHLLVPVDFTTKNQAALDIAFEIGKQNDARVTLLHVIETIENVPKEELKSFYDQLTARATSQLESRCQRFEDAGIKIDWKLRYGKRVFEVVQDAHDRKVDLIVMSSHRVDPAAGLQGLGTLSYEVSILCDCPVLLVK